MDWNDYPFDTVGKYRISTICLQSYPCQHYVVDTTTGKADVLTAVDMYKMLEREGLYYEHVAYCRESTANKG